MAFLLSVLYLLTYYLTPAVLFGPLAQIHIEIVLAILILIVSIPRIMRSFVFKTPQTLALVGLSIAVFLSVLIGVHWPGGAVNAFLGFIPNMYAFFLIALHCNSRKKLQILAVMLLFVCVFVIVNGARDLRYANAMAPTGSTPTDKTASERLEIEHPYVLSMTDDSGHLFYRVRGVGQINDPNDFGQVLVCEIPLLFLFWRRKKRIRNFAFVIIPVCVLCYGIFLTHSRGALLALLVVVVVAARRRIGTLPAGIIAAALFAGAMALQFTGGRAISAGAGAGREELWGESLQILKYNPIFGIGLGELPGYIGHTAHNSIVVCATELGLFGLFFWTLFLLPTMRNALLTASPKKVSEAPKVKTQDDPFSLDGWRGGPPGKAEINHLGFCLLLSLAGFLAAGWFLSRALVLTFFLLGGMSEVVYETAQRRGMVAPRPPYGRVLVQSVGFMFALLLLVYVMLRILNVTR